MAGTHGVVLVGGLQIYGSVLVHGGGLRLRVRANEWAALGFAEGQTVGVTVPPAAGSAEVSRCRGKEKVSPKQSRLGSKTQASNAPMSGLAPWGRTAPR